MPASAGIVSVPISAPKRGRPASIRRISAASARDLDRAGGEQRLADALALGGGDDQVDPVGGADREALGAADGDGFAGVLGQRRAAGDLGRAGADQREERALAAGVGDLDLAADLVHLQVAAGRRQPLRLEVEPELGPSPGRSTRMSACMWPLRSSSAA